jgi:CRP-like cAMP-binding protein
MSLPIDGTPVHGEEIAHAPICEGLSSEDVATLARHMSASSHPHDAVLYEEGSLEANDLLIILDGHVEISTRQRFGGETLTLKLDPGDVAGILGFVGGRPHVGTARAVSDCRVGRLSREQFAHLCENHGGIAIRILRFLVLALDGFSSNLIERYKESLSFMYGAMHTKK